jgi:hypothetical protein
MEVVSKAQIMFESPAIQRGFTPILIKIMEFNKRPADWKRSPPHILADKYFNLRGNPPRIVADYRTLDGVLKPLLSDSGKSHKLIIFGIHFVSVDVFTAEFKFNVSRIDGAVSSCILSNGKINRSG